MDASTLQLKWCACIHRRHRGRNTGGERPPSDSPWHIQIPLLKGQRFFPVNSLLKPDLRTVLFFVHFHQWHDSDMRETSEVPDLRFGSMDLGQGWKFVGVAGRLHTQHQDTNVFRREKKERARHLWTQLLNVFLLKMWFFNWTASRVREKRRESLSVWLQPELSASSASGNCGAVWFESIIYFKRLTLRSWCNPTNIEVNHGSRIRAAPVGTQLTLPATFWWEIDVRRLTGSFRPDGGQGWVLPLDGEAWWMCAVGSR